MKKLLYVFMFVPFTLFAQEVIGLIQNTQNALNGYALINPMRSSSTYLIDNCGNNVYEWQSSNISLGAKLLDDGRLIRSFFAPSDSIMFGGVTGGIEILDPSGSQIWEILINSDSLCLHHDFEVLPNGNILAIVAEVIDSVDVVNAGSTSQSKRFSETIIEINPESLDIVWKWRAWDHIIQENDPLLPNYGVIRDHPEKIDVDYFIDNKPINDWLHFNSIDYNEDLDQIMISTPHFSELWIIDHSTTTIEASTDTGGEANKGGDLLYRWGNPFAYKRGLESDQKFEYQHDCSWVNNGLPDEGNIMIFNNGDIRGYSSVDIIDPYSGSNSYSLSSDSSYLPYNSNTAYSDSANFFSNRVSSVKNLENGNLFICSGWEGRIFEVEPQSNTVVWDYELPFYLESGNSFLMSQGDTSSRRRIIFQSDKYPVSFKGFEHLNLNLESANPIELNPIAYDCQTYVLGCTNTDASNFEPAANTDNNSCVSWEELANDLQTQLDNIVPEDGVSQEDVDAAYAAGTASVTPEDGITQADVDAAFADGVASVEVPECEEWTTQNMPLDLPQGWSMFGYTCLESLDVIEAFFEISDNIEIVKDEWGLAYLPAWGFSAFETLEFGEGYQIKMIEEVTDFQFCTSIAGGASQEELDAAYAEGAASVTPEDGVTQADVEAVQQQLNAANQTISELQEESITDPYHLNLIEMCLSGDGLACMEAYGYQTEELPQQISYCLEYGDPMACEEALTNYPEELANLLGLTNYELDDCGVPNGDNSTCLDLCGVLNGDNSSCVDECGVPYGDNSTCLDCAGVVNGPSVDLGCGCDIPLPDGYDCGGNLLQIGDITAGGIIFEINEDGTGLVACAYSSGHMDWSESIYWAANIEADDPWHGNGYDDWRLPTIEELELMYNTIGPGGDDSGNFIPDDHWSSSDSDLQGPPWNGFHAWYVKFSNGNKEYGHKDNTKRVRIVRAF